MKDCENVRFFFGFHRKWFPESEKSVFYELVSVSVYAYVMSDNKHE